ncbi:HTH domain-containing protein [Halopelagius fulvigenes]|uniref:HTH domain-containing protein n=1 Tax=Halopelagius fulvigenes TaxID=1198324 RepID=A0ABD5TTQ7_9EURY
MASGDTHTRAELYVRSLAPRGAQASQESVVQRLLDMESEQEFEFSVTVWGDQIATDSAVTRTEAGRTMIETVRQFESWAATNGYTVEPFFSDVRRESLLDGSYDAIIPPHLCLALYEDGDVAGVFPCSDRDANYTVEDALEAMTADEDIPPLSATTLDADDSDADDRFSEEEAPTYVSPIPLDE